MLLIFIIGIWFHIVPVMPDDKQAHVGMVDFKSFEPYLHIPDDTVHIITFWATWCGPCRTEIPEFDRFHRERAGKKVKILLVSLDFPNQKDRSLASFIETNRITAPVILLNDPDANAWIDKVDPAWSGSLPATLIYKGTSRYFLEKSLTYDDLNQYILLLNP